MIFIYVLSPGIILYTELDSKVLTIILSLDISYLKLLKGEMNR